MYSPWLPYTKDISLLFSRVCVFIYFHMQTIYYCYYLELQYVFNPFDMTFLTNSFLNFISLSSFEFVVVLSIPIPILSPYPYKDLNAMTLLARHIRKPH